jgi:pyruvate dehydrogenase E2 component (dihydrolipoamide acetyltransferase)
MRYEFKLPDLAEGMVEGELVGWLIAAGDVVKAEQPVAEVMTDKATVVIPSPVAGKALELPWHAGDIIKIGQVLAVFDAEGDAPAQRAQTAHALPAADAPKVTKAESVKVTQSETPKAEAMTEVAKVEPTAEVATVPRGSRALAAPATRRLARELGVDIAEVTGTGPGGRVTPEDVQRKAEPPKAAIPTAPVTASQARPASKPTWAPTPRAATQGESEERQKLRGLRRAIYDAMTRSKSTAAHFTYVDEVDCENLFVAREKLGKALAPKGVKLTYLAFISKAVLLALPKFPKMNATVDDANQEVVLKKHVHLGIAAATDPGLVVPVIRHADKLTLTELAWHIQDLGERAKVNRLKPEELKGSTFTISSLGKLGGLHATPIINHPEVAIVGIHQMQKRAVVLEDEGDRIVARRRMNLSLSFDHRLIDGHEGAAFAQEVKRYLEDPELMLLEMV